jgi:hypothetical protein
MFGVLLLYLQCSKRLYYIRHTTPCGNWHMLSFWLQRFSAMSLMIRLSSLTSPLASSNNLHIITSTFFQKYQYPRLSPIILINDIGAVSSRKGLHREKIPLLKLLRLRILNPKGFHCHL